MRGFLITGPAPVSGPSGAPGVMDPHEKTRLCVSQVTGAERKVFSSPRLLSAALPAYTGCGNESCISQGIRMDCFSQETE